MSSGEAWHFRVRHILEEIARIERYTRGLDASALAADEKTLDAVLHNFQVTGEAARKLPAAVKRRHPGVTHEIRSSIPTG
jgi:uncharacterized protein with HEPN domain